MNAKFPIPTRSGNSTVVVYGTYDIEDPLAVTLVFPGAEKDEPWVLSREMLRDAIIQPKVGEGIVRFFLVSHKEIGLDLVDATNNEAFRFFLNRQAVARFVARTYELVPEKEESVDDALNEWIRQVLLP